MLSINLLRANVVLRCLQTLLSWCSFLVSYCNTNRSQSGVGTTVEIQLLSELDKTGGLSANKSDSKRSHCLKSANSKYDQNLSSVRQTSSSAQSSSYCSVDVQQPSVKSDIDHKSLQLLASSRF